MTINPIDKSIEAVEKLGSFAAKVLKEPLDEASGMVADRIRYMRWERLHRLIDRYETFIENRQKINKTVAAPPKLLIPVLENASLEDNDLLQDLWARLLATATHPEMRENVRNAFVDMIKQLDPIDVLILKHIYESYQKSLNEEVIPPGFSPIKHAVPREKLMEGLGVSRHVYHTSADNLMRIRCIVSQVLESSIDLAPSQKGQKSKKHRLHFTRDMQYRNVCLTPLGLLFVKSCIAEESSK